MKLSKLIQMVLPQQVVWATSFQEVEIEWVSTVASQSQPNDLLLLPGADAMDQWLSSAPSQKPAAILVNAAIAPDSLPKKFAKPVLLLQQPLDFQELHQNLLKNLMSVGQNLLEKRFAIHEQLSKAAVEEGSMFKIAQTMQEITGHAVLIQDKRLDVIAAVPSPALVEVWRDIVSSLKLVQFLPENLQNRKAAATFQAPIHQSVSGGLERLLIPITVDQVARGYLSIIHVQDCLDQIDHITIMEGALFCSIEMAHIKAMRETEKKLQSNLLQAILHCFLSARDAELGFQAMGLDETQAHIPIQFAWDAPNAPSCRRLETVINGIIKKDDLTAIINPTGDKVICFYQLPKDVNYPEVPVQFASAVIDQANREYPGIAVRCGVGTAAQDTNSWNLAFKESGFALDLAFRTQANRPLFYPELSIYRLLMLWEKHPESEKFKQDLLGRLLQQDNKKVLLETLDAYYQSNGNLSKASAALFIHRNTLTYRLERIAELCKFDFSNSNSNLAMQVALRLHFLEKL
jgi:purine catabolism regulator